MVLRLEARVDMDINTFLDAEQATFMYTRTHVHAHASNTLAHTPNSTPCQPYSSNATLHPYNEQNKSTTKNPKQTQNN